MTIAALETRDRYWEREVFPHTDLCELTQNLWVVQGEFPAAKLPRNMVVYRYAKRSLLLHSVVALNEQAMSKLEALGEPSVMVIPHWDHWAHVAAYKRRYPKMDVVCPQASIAGISKHVHVDYSSEEYFPRHGVKYYVPPGINPVEGVLEVSVDENKVAVIMNDLITNVPHQPGLYGLLLRLTRSTGRPRVIFFVRRSLRVRRTLVKKYIESLVGREEITVVTTSHGDCLVKNIAQTLATVAQDL
ncbi:hypothetical protein [Dyella caseinilytica]|uniref:MBL fold metallo-hydrolase n=1 Tax=Dyella caseinilytica TaxID=1849581 RepID=A0ABX7GT01_9GAMM|nr:hypothetical protein [Dyella caseinilytica]QRN53575.1 hypothetical protein ISN74_19570 [Dyella caseinilytica]GFZ87599.1 hypothetical protein GCM10011408_02770 [Dyella caseinilytica]